MKSTRSLTAGLLDVAVIALFVALGRAEHDSSRGLAAFAITVVPFLIALVTTRVVPVVRSQPSALTSGVCTWIITITVGMALRRLLFSDGIAIAFIIVATLFNGAGMLGWRLVNQTVFSRSSRA